MASFLGQLDVWITNVGLPNIGQGVGSTSLSALSWVLNGYAIVFAALLVPSARPVDDHRSVRPHLADRGGPDDRPPRLDDRRTTTRPPR